MWNVTSTKKRNKNRKLREKEREIIAVGKKKCSK